jgi:methionyl aminopeptidase
MKLKNPRQIERIRESGLILAHTLRELGTMVEPGLPLIELDTKCRSLLEAAGARPAFLGYMGFPSSVCVSVNEAVIHGIPTKRRLKDGDVVSLDIGVDLEGFISDSAATFRVGTVSPEIDQLLRVTDEALWKGIAAARPGGRVHDISAAVFEHVAQYGYGIVRPYCGHGVGFAVHEEPQVPNYVSRGPNPRLKPGMVLAIEPMINLGGDEVDVLDDDWTVVTLDRSVSAHYEHTIAIVDDGVQVLTYLEETVEVS